MVKRRRELIVSSHPTPSSSETMRERGCPGLMRSLSQTHLCPASTALNCPPRQAAKLAGQNSEAMIMATEAGGVVKLLVAPQDAGVGERLYLAGGAPSDGCPKTLKTHFWETCKENLKVRLRIRTTAHALTANACPAQRLHVASWSSENGANVGRRAHVSRRRGFPLARSVVTEGYTHDANVWARSGRFSVAPGRPIRKFLQWLYALYGMQVAGGKGTFDGKELVVATGPITAAADIPDGAEIK